MDEYESIILSYDFDYVVAYKGEGTGDNFGFMWKADVNNKEAMESVAARNNKILEVERGVWKRMDEFLTKKREDKEKERVRH